MHVKVKIENPTPLIFEIDDSATIADLKKSLEAYIEVIPANQKIHTLLRTLVDDEILVDVVNQEDFENLNGAAISVYADSKFVCFLQFYSADECSTQAGFLNQPQEWSKNPIDKMRKYSEMPYVSDDSTESNSCSSSSSSSSSSSDSTQFESFKSGLEREHIDQNNTSKQAISSNFQDILDIVLTDDNVKGTHDMKRSASIENNFISKRARLVEEPLPLATSSKLDLTDKMPNAGTEAHARSELQTQLGAHAGPERQDQPELQSECELQAQSELPPQTMLQGESEGCSVGSNKRPEDNFALGPNVPFIVPEKRRYALVICNDKSSIRQPEYNFLMAHYFELFQVSNVSLGFDENTSVLLNDGKLWIICDDDPTCEWLAMGVSNLHPYKCLRFSDHYDLIKCQVVIPIVVSGSDMERVFKLLETQNPGLSTRLWCVSDRKILPQGDSYDSIRISTLCENEILDLFLDKETKNFLMQNGSKMRYCFWTLCFKF